MTEIIKDGVVMAARDNHQLAAFLNNGWKVRDSDIPKPEMPTEQSVADNSESEEPLPISDENITLEEKEEHNYTKTDINTMSTEKLQALAAQVGIENAYETSGNKLKGILADHFGL